MREPTAGCVPFGALHTRLPLVASLAARSARSPGLPTTGRASERHVQTASTSPAVSRARAVGASRCLGGRRTPHRGGKRPVPQRGQVPYSRLSVMSCPSAPCRLRGRFPRACNGVFHTEHAGRSCALAPLPLRLVLWCAVSWSNGASSRLVRAWTSSSMSRKGAFGWLLRHSLISVNMRSLRSRQCSSGVWSMGRLHVVDVPILSLSLLRVSSRCTHLTPTLWQQPGLVNNCEGPETQEVLMEATTRAHGSHLPRKSKSLF
jgi:hypothetical protein